MKHKEFKEIGIKKSKSGGQRPGSGRPKGSGKYRETTRPIRIPTSLIGEVQNLLSFYQNKMGSQNPINAIHSNKTMVNESVNLEKFSANLAQENVHNLTSTKISNSNIHRMDNLVFAENVFRPAIQPKSNHFPLYASKVAAGFPSPADDYIEAKLDLNQFLIKRPAATFFVRVEGESMINAGIHPDDILVVDRSIKPTDGKIVIAVLNGELTVKRLKLTNSSTTLLPENDRFSPISITEEMNFSVWGVVTSVIHSV